MATGPAGSELSALCRRLQCFEPPVRRPLHTLSSPTASSHLLRDAEQPSRCLTSIASLRRRHHCRHCGRIACSDCSAHKSAIPKFGVSKPTRVCMDCAPVLNGKAGAALVVGSPWTRPPDTMAMAAHLDQQLAATAGPPPSPERSNVAAAFAAAAASPGCQVEQLLADGSPPSAPQAAADSGGDPWALPLSPHDGLAGSAAEEKRHEDASPSEASSVNPFGASLNEGASPTEDEAASANPFGASTGAVSNPFGEADSPSTRTTLRNLSDAVFLSPDPPQSGRK